MAITVRGSVFRGRDQEGDFGWMIGQPEHERTLFVFNDNEEQFRAYFADRKRGAGCVAGGGNAVIRPYRCQDPPRAAGIPTGSGGRGYERLTDEVRVVIEEAIGVIRGLLDSGAYDQLLYSAANADGDLGTGIFTVGDDVRRYIVDRLWGLGRE